jgi:hypothetical protein
MRSRTRSLTWQGQPFRFEYLGVSEPDNTLWAVWRQREFIGTMPCSPEIPTKDFDVRGIHWLAELLGSPPKNPGFTPPQR